MSEAGFERIDTGHGAVDIASIERELSQLWQHPPDEDPVTRACMSNLIVYCADGEAAARAPEEIARIVQIHPSRVLLLVGEAGPSGTDVEAYVSALCHLGSGGRQICSEHVTIHASRDPERKLASGARPLLLGDLPTALWWTPSDAPSGRDALFESLAGMANQIIYDSHGWPDPVRGVLATAEWVESARDEHVISDLAWRRVKPLRRLISQTFDPAVLPGALDTIESVYVEHTPHALPQAWLLIGWLSRLLGWRPQKGKVEPGHEVSWGFMSDHGPIEATVHRLAEGDPVIRKVVVRWKGPEGRSSATFSTLGPSRLAVELDGTAAPTRFLAAPSQERPALVAGQLRKLFRDPLFPDTLEVSRHMAEALAR